MAVTILNEDSAAAKRGQFGHGVDTVTMTVTAACSAQNPVPYAVSMHTPEWWRPAAVTS